MQLKGLGWEPNRRTIVPDLDYELEPGEEEFVAIHFWSDSRSTGSSAGKEGLIEGFDDVVQEFMEEHGTWLRFYAPSGV